MKKTCVCIIMTKNGAERIGNAIRSALDSRLFEKILIVQDTSSNDGSGLVLEAWRRKYPHIITIIGHNWQNPPDFSEARNRSLWEAIRRIGTEYFFILDDDEIILNPKAVLGLLLTANGQAFTLYHVSPLSNGGTHTMYLTRLCPLVPGVRFDCAVFEEADYSLEELGIPVERTDVTAYYHFGYLDRKTSQSKTRRNVESAAAFLQSYKKQDKRREHIQTEYRRMTRRD